MRNEIFRIQNIDFRLRVDNDDDVPALKKACDELNAAFERVGDGGKLTLLDTTTTRRMLYAMLQLLCEKEDASMKATAPAVKQRLQELTDLCESALSKS